MYHTQVKNGRIKSLEITVYSLSLALDHACTYITTYLHNCLPTVLRQDMKVQTTKIGFVVSWKLFKGCHSSIHENFLFSFSNILTIKMKCRARSYKLISQRMGWSPGLVIIGGDSCSDGYGFESQHCILDGHFFTYLCCRNCNVCSKRRK